jgi:hypothetical protein
LFVEQDMNKKRIPLIWLLPVLLLLAACKKDKAP